MILLHGESCNFSTTLPSMADGGEVYAFRSYHGRLSASTAVARGSGTSDTNRGNLVLNLVATKSILGRCHLLHRVEDLWKEKPLFGWSGLVWIACLLPHSAGLECVCFRVTCFLVHQVKILHSRAQRGPDLPPSLFMYDTTVVLSVATSTILFEQRSWNSFKARKTALSSR